MATTTNYAWETPDDTDLVKDGAAAIRTLGSSIDTTTKALNPSTTLGDIEYRSSTANTNTRLGIGTTGQVLSVSGGVPAWTTPVTGGGMTLLASGTISGTVNLTSIDQTYEELVLYVWDFTNTVTSELNYRFNNDSGSNYGILRLSGQNTTSVTEMRNGDTSINPVAGDTIANATNQHSVLRVPNYTAPANKLATAMSSTYAVSTSENQIRQLTCAYRSSTAISQISILNCTSGNYELFGVK